MKDTPENKAKFLSHYLGKVVLLHERGKAKLMSVSLDGRCWVECNNGHEIWNINHITLVARKLSSITDEEVMQMHVDLTGAKVSKKESELIKESLLDTLKSHIGVAVSDWLRGHGFALPWNGVSVEELVKRNWIKLI